MERLSLYISHPEKLNRDTLYELRMIVRKYPYFDVARLLMLKNLYLLHDIEFGKELRTAALYLKNRLPLFNLISGYDDFGAEEKLPDDVSVDRTISLIDAFLETLPSEKLSLEAESVAAVDYVSAYLKDKNKIEPVAPAPALRGQDIIDEFLANGNERITLDLGGGVEEAVTKCAICNCEIDENSSHLDHIVPFKMVGDELENNLQLLCGECNLSKSGSINFYLKTFVKRFLIKK